MGKWEKLGRIYDPALSTLGGYGANPVAVPLSNGLQRIFFNIRDTENRSYITFLDFDMEKLRIVDFPGKMLVSPGELGAFDDMGCSLGNIVELPDKLLIYYLGWNIPRRLPWTNAIGLAIYDKRTEECYKYSKAQIMGRSDTDPFSLAYPYVMKTADGYKMWYGSCLTWRDTTLSHFDFVYAIKYATSENGIEWSCENNICIQGDGKKEYAFARPSVLFEKELYMMWYAYRGDKFRIGYAESSDGITWVRKDREAGIDVSKEDWESEEVCYPYVFLANGHKYMLYCGNGYGRTGFGLARLVEGEK